MFAGRLGRSVSWFVPALLVVTAVVIRYVNAFQYNILWGFDAKYNWRYIRTLYFDWTLPAPDADWSTSHPPFFYYLSAALCRLVEDLGRDEKVILLRLLSSTIGLGMAALAVAIVRRAEPGNRKRAWMAGAVVLFLPVHIYMSAMLSEEILASTLISLVLVGVAWHLPETRPPRRALPWAAGLGVVAGIAFMTKLTGVLVVGAAGVAYLLDGWRRGDLRRALGYAVALGTMALLFGGWYYVRNYIGWGYIYPHGLEHHKIMFEMPPGERHLSDYFYLPLAIWRDPRVIEPDLLRSIWGSTYITLWFDGHRNFLPIWDENVTRAGRLILTLALLPTVAFFVGAARGLRRAVRDGSMIDSLFLTMIFFTVAGYISFSIRNPWFPVLKAGFMLCLSVPFAYYISEVLDGWTRGRNWRSAAVWTVCVALLVAVAATFTITELFWNTHHMWKPGVMWR